MAASEIENILDLARWAPSGDNLQPWRFAASGPGTVIVTIPVEGEDRNVYDYANGEATLLTGGFLLETMRIAASRFERKMHWTYLGKEETGNGGESHRVKVDLPKDPSVTEDPLCPYITVRSVDRRAYRRASLTAPQKGELESALGDELQIEWRESLAQRWRLARLLARTTDIRLRMPEAYQVHRRILDWNRSHSPDGVPVLAVGVDPITRNIMRFVMADWRRVDVMNRYFWGTAMPRLELDLIPGLYSAAYFIVSSKSGSRDGEIVPPLLRAGAALQRFWLTASRLGLAMQPALAPLCFAYYSRTGNPPASARERIAKFASKAKSCLPNDGPVLFMGRIGTPKKRPPAGRSIRRGLRELLSN